MELIDLQGSKDSKPKFLAEHIFDFCKNHVLTSWLFADRTIHTQ